MRFSAHALVALMDPLFRCPHAAIGHTFQVAVSELELRHPKLCRLLQHIRHHLVYAHVVTLPCRHPLYIGGMVLLVCRVALCGESSSVAGFAAPPSYTRRVTGVVAPVSPCLLGPTLG